MANTNYIVLIQSGEHGGFDLLLGLNEDGEPNTVVADGDQQAIKRACTTMHMHMDGETFVAPPASSFKIRRPKTKTVIDWG
jgi:hypothetical protein